MKAIWINAEQNKIEEVELDGSLGDYYKHIGCDCMTTVQFDEKHTIYVDDEGLLKQPYIDVEGNKHNMHGFAFAYYPYPIMGNGVIVGTDGCGESCDAELNPLEVLAIVDMIQYENPQDRPRI